ncbi:hypothetical protein ACET3X_002160 [Alternaria dauci]|uniref:Zn(2)-C6 fungal-type domain-containing protein n=1 Tax=Alternaria dauci TaxID=48095 RepID=A0ABR3UNR3_9PLEO
MATEDIVTPGAAANDNPHDALVSPQALAPTRRKRVSLACRSCRSRKTKCDGIQPACSTCQHLGIDCVYAKAPRETGSKRAPGRAQSMHKVRRLNHQFHAITENSAMTRPDDTVDAAIRRSDVTDRLNAHAEAEQADDSDSNTTGDISEQEASEEVHAAKVFQDQHASEFGYFGLSSNHAFFRSISRCFLRFLRGVPPQHGQTQPLTTEDWSEADTSRAHQMGSSPQCNPAATLPAISESFSMLDRFVATSADVFPFVSKAALTTTLKELAFAPRQSISKTKRALVNIMFAYSCLAIGNLQCDMYFQRTVRCLTPETLRSASLELIQALLLLTSYQQQQQMPVSSATYHALTVKAAFQLGLQCPSSYKELSPSDSEFRKRTWYSLINQDRILCMCLGRPCLIPPQHIRTPGLEDPRHTHHLSSIAYEYEVESLLQHKYQT